MELEQYDAGKNYLIDAFVYDGFRSKVFHGRQRQTDEQVYIKVNTLALLF